MYTIDEVMAVAYSNETAFVLMWFITYFFGFAQYFSSIYMQLKNKSCPFYFWMHAWYFGHDMLWALCFYQWFYEIDYWLFKIQWFAVVAFVFVELYSCYRAVRYERQEIWGKYYHGEEVTLKRGLFHAIMGYAAGFIIFAGIRQLIGDPMFLVLMMSTNATLALCLHLKIDETGISLPGTKAVSWFTLLGTCFTFAPAGIGWFATSVAQLDQPAFYIVGALSVLASIRAIYLSYKLPKGTIEDTDIPMTIQHPKEDTATA